MALDWRYKLIFHSVSFGISLPIFFKIAWKGLVQNDFLCIKNIPWRGMLHACSAFIWLRSFQTTYTILRPGRVAQSVTCLVTDAKLTADPGVASSIPARSHTFVEIDHEIISTVILLPSAESSMKGCCQLQVKVCARLLVNCLFKLAQEKSLVRWTDRPAITIAVDLGRKTTKQTNDSQNSNFKDFDDTIMIKKEKNKNNMSYSIPKLKVTEHANDVTEMCTKKVKIMLVYIHCQTAHQKDLFPYLRY